MALRERSRVELRGRSAPVGLFAPELDGGEVSTAGSPQ